MFWESIFWEEQDKYQALKWKKPYFPVSITFPRLQQSIHEVPNGIFSNQRTKTFSRLLGDMVGGQRKRSQKDNYYRENITVVAYDILLCPKLAAGELWRRCSSLILKTGDEEVKKEQIYTFKHVIFSTQNTNMTLLIQIKPKLVTFFSFERLIFKQAT